MRYKTNRCSIRVLAFAALAGLALVAGCSKPPTRVGEGDRLQILHRGSSSDPQELDPHIVQGVGEHNILQALLENLVTEDPTDLHPVPGQAESWDISPDGTTYTFHLRAGIRWSNGDPVTAQDFASVGAQALDERTLRITLNGPVPYFLSLLNHYSWWPVHLPTIARYGDPYQRNNRWTRPGNFVGNGPFVLARWDVGHVIVVKKNPLYWNAASVKLNEIHFHPIESADTEERSFRSGQLHVTEQVPQSKISVYRRDSPQLLRIDPYL